MVSSAVDDWRLHRGLPPVRWDACELNPAYRAELAAKARRVIIGDFLSAGRALGHGYAVAIGNPPYALAERFVREARQRARIVAMLLRLNFLASEERQAFFADDVPDMLVLPNRPTFAIFVKRGKDGKLKRTSSDSCEYAWFVWGEKRRRRGAIERLSITPAAVRAYWRARAPVIKVQEPARRGLLTGSHAKPNGRVALARS